MDSEVEGTIRSVGDVVVVIAFPLASVAMEIGKKHIATSTLMSEGNAKITDWNCDDPPTPALIPKFGKVQVTLLLSHLSCRIVLHLMVPS